MFGPRGDKAGEEPLPGCSASSSVAPARLSSLPLLKERRNIWPIASSSSLRRDRPGQRASLVPLLVSRQTSAL